MGDESSQVSRPLSEDVQAAMKKKQEAIRALYGENKEITDGSYDESLAVKCINGTFVGKKSEDVITYRGIPFVGDQPVGEYRWKAPVEYRPDEGVYEAEKTGESEIMNIGANAQINLARDVVVTNAQLTPTSAEIAKAGAEFFGPDGRHAYDYMYYYNNIKDNAAKRVTAYLNNRT